MASSEWPPASKKLSSGSHLVLEQLLPDVGELGLKSGQLLACARGGRIRRVSRPGAWSASRRARSSLPLGVRGSSATGHDGRRDHVGGQLLRKLGAHRLGDDVVRARVADDEGDQAPGLTVADSEHGSLRDIVTALEDGRDLGRLNAVAADLYLLVGAAEELQLAGRQAACQIAGMVTALAVGVLEHGGRLLGIADVAARHSGATDHELPRDADRYRLAERVEHVGGGSGDRVADRHGCRWRTLTAGSQLVGTAADVVSVGP